jgi:hypothetical protein
VTGACPSAAAVMPSVSVTLVPPGGGGGCARADVVAGSLRHAPCAGTMHPCTRTDN